MIICQTCGVEIPANWVHAISSNVCPGHGGPIFNETSKELLTELTKAMEEMPNNPAGLAGWLLSNYNLSKIGDAVPVEFYGNKAKNSNINPNKNNDFLKRAGVDSDKYQKLVKQIEESQNEMYGSNQVEEYSEEKVVARTPDEIAFMNSAMPMNNCFFIIIDFD